MFPLLITHIRKPRCPKWRMGYIPGRKDVLTGLPEGGRWQREVMDLSNRASSSPPPLLLACLGWPSRCLFNGDSFQLGTGCTQRAQRDQLPMPVPIQNHGGCSSEGWGFGGIPSHVDAPQRLSNRKEVLEGGTGFPIQCFHTLPNTPPLADV